jgi:hypothetical protein
MAAVVLSEEQREKITEEETVREDARYKVHKRHGLKNGSCGACGYKPACAGCRVWGLLFGVMVVLFLFRMIAWSTYGPAVFHH